MPLFRSMLGRLSQQQPSAGHVLGALQLLMRSDVQQW